MRQILLAFAFLSLGIAFVGCSSSTDPTEPLVIPPQIDSVAWATNAAGEIAYVNDLTALLTETKRARTTGVVLDPNVVNEKFAPVQRLLNADDLSYIAQVIAGAVSASGKTMDPMASPSVNGDGGVFVRYLFDEYGTDINEHIEKTMFSLALHRNAMRLLDTATPTVANVDRALALFGATPAFRNSAADKFCAGYAARRDKNDGSGFYTKIRDAFKKARAAAGAGSKYNTDYRDAVATIKKEWERSQMATAVNYCYATASTLGATTVTDSARAGGMHAFGEAVGFFWGWTRTPSTLRSITDAQLADVLNLLRAPATGPWTFYETWQTPSTALDELITVTQRIQAVYGFSDAEMLEFKTNWVSSQGRQ